MLEYLLNLFRFVFGKSSSIEEKEQDEDIRNIVTRYSKGNISLQMGNYITEEDIEYLRNIVRNHNFCK